MTASLSAQLVSYRVNATVDNTRYGTPFGVSEPYSFSVTFTFDLTANPHFSSFSQEIDPTTTRTWYLFTAESITEVSGNFGTWSFTAQDLMRLVGNLPTEAPEDDIPLAWFLADTDLTTAPSMVMFAFTNPDESETLAGSFIHDEYVPEIKVKDVSNDSVALSYITSIETITVVPEPSTYAAIAGAGVLGFAVWRRRRANASRG